MQKFLRVALPLILLAVFLVIALFVLNTVETIEFMENTQRTGPTILNPNPPNY